LAGHIRRYRDVRDATDAEERAHNERIAAPHAKKLGISTTDMLRITRAFEQNPEGFANARDLGSLAGAILDGQKRDDD
jgi:hypothetical protein